jgi:hypothetical protein
MSYTVILDGVTLQNEPMGLMDAKLEVYRDNQNPGIFNAFISDVTFWGDGYDILLPYFQSDETCKTVKVKIIEDCANGLNFDGIIYVEDLEINLDKCNISCSIEDDSIIGRITRFSDTRVPINTGQSMSQTSEGGVTLTDIGSIKNTPYYDSNTSSYTTIEKRWFNILETSDYVLKYLTDGKCDAKSVYLSDPSKVYRPDTWQITVTFANLPSVVVPAANWWTVTFKISGDIFGEDIFISSILSGLQPWAAAYNLANVLSSHTWKILQPGTIDFSNDDVNRGNIPTRAFSLYSPTNLPPNPATDPAPIYLEFPWNVSNIELVDVRNWNDTVSDLTRLQVTITSPASEAGGANTNFNYGANNFVFTSGNVLRAPSASQSAPFVGKEQIMNVSFSDLSSGVYGLFNLCIIPKRNPDGTYTIELEPEPETFDASTQIFEVNDIKDLMYKRSDDFVFSSLETGLTGSRTGFPLHQSTGFTTNVCSENAFNATSTFFPSNYADIAFRSDNLVDENIYMAELYTPNPNSVAFYQVTKSQFATTTSGQNTIGRQAYQESCYSVINHFVARNHINKTRNGYLLNGKVIPKTNNTFPWWDITGLDVSIRNALEFQYPIKTSQINDILANPFGYILCDGKKGWINKISYSIKTGMTTFELLTE